MEQNTINPTINPLQGFYRKAKFQMSLPSEGRWYQKDTLRLNADSTVDVFAMTAADDIKFRAGEASLTGHNTYTLIKNCIPNIIDPVDMPSIDLDTILLAIRMASYGDNMEISCDVPNTSLVRKIPIKISGLLKKLPTSKDWDSILEITNETGEKIIFDIKPTPLKDVFNATKNIIKTKQQLQSMSQNGNDTDADLLKFDANIQTLGDVTINIVAASIESITFSNGATEKNPIIILDLLSGMDVAYFNTIKEHLEVQREKFTLKTDTIISTDKELAVGAPASWTAPVLFAGADFFQKK